MTPAEETDIKIRILKAAKKLFAIQGYDGTSIRQICEEAGANVALVSYHFGGKENLFRALLETFFPHQRLSEIDPNMHPVEGVKLIIREVTMYRQADPQLISIVQQEINLSTPRIQTIREYIMPMWRFLHKWLDDGKRQGIFQFRSLDTAFMSIVGMLVFHRSQEYWRALQEENPVDTEKLIEDMTDFILRGLHYKGE